MTAEQLGGGVANAGLVTREGDVVRRPLPPNAATLHRLLDHLAATDFQAPQPLAVEGDREVVRFIPGDVAVPPFPAWSMTDDVLRDIGAFLRRYHEAVAGFDPPATATWSAELADLNGGPIVCHNDVCPENIVFQDGRVVALARLRLRRPRSRRVGCRPDRSLLVPAHRPRAWPTRSGDHRSIHSIASRRSWTRTVLGMRNDARSSTCSSRPRRCP